MTTTREIETRIREIEARIRELESTPRAMVGSDSGTHGGPAIHHIYEEITGERYAVREFAGSNGTRCTEEEARELTDGRIRIFPDSTKEIRAKGAELRRLRAELQKMDR